MSDLSLCVTAMTHVLYGIVRSGHERMTSCPDAVTADRDRGAVSLEQVLWFVAAGVSVAVIAAILWNQIRDQANTPVNAPTGP